ncbi:hypothetical protein [Gordonia westfalica]|nr:hypothetical protein [Gordonia westfalica]
MPSIMAQHSGLRISDTPFPVVRVNADTGRQVGEGAMAVTFVHSRLAST